MLIDDTSSQAFNNRSFSSTRLSDKNWIVLGTARKDLNNALYFTAAADNRIQFISPSELGKIPTILVQGGRLAGLFSRTGLFTLLSYRGEDGLTQFYVRQPVFF